MALTTAERNKRKRERKKRDRLLESQKRPKTSTAANAANTDDNDNVVGSNAAEDVEIEYVAEPLIVGSGGIGGTVGEDGSGVIATEDTTNNAASTTNANGDNNDNNDDDQDLQAIMRRFQSRAAVVYVTDDELKKTKTTAREENDDDDDDANYGTAKNNQQDNDNNEMNDNDNDDNDNDDDNNNNNLSKRQLKTLLRPSIASLKQTVSHPELVEAHDVTAPDPKFLVYLKGAVGTVPVPRHWGRKRKYLQGKVSYCERAKRAVGIHSFIHSFIADCHFVIDCSIHLR